ncbi:unnamed protein product [Cylicostephanus goldi]|uniref:Myosin motor domain-containing protein n=1 Tax=Cylicostephanus goldi TaxID=71465 RepID=A0A3P7N4G2_CYLGO|nr:unnamed protein product [Cylicostephanus goldi]
MIVKNLSAENYRISGFRLKDDHQGFGNVADLRSALIQLGISHEDVFKCQLTRDQLVSAIYTRVLRMILMRANTSLGSLMGLEENIDMKRAGKL